MSIIFQARPNITGSIPDMYQEIIDRAKELGFINVGFSIPKRPIFFDRFTSWISGHKNADMSWLARNREIREDPSLLLRDCHTIISLAYPYSSEKPSTPEGLTVSRYSEPAQEDYHYRLKALCRHLVDMIKDIHGGLKARICVDSAPVLERSLACSSGIGFVGKNNMLIIPGIGSYFYLAEILTTVSLELPLTEPMDSQCGPCTLCVDACPTGALEAPFLLNASKCLSYLTVESKTILTGGDGKPMGDCFFGCDRCQEVCPYNRKKVGKKVLLPPYGEILGMDIKDFQEKFGKTSLARAGLEKIQMNIRAITG